MGSNDHHYIFRQEKKQQGTKTWNTNFKLVSFYQTSDIGQLTTDNRQLTTDNRQLTTDNRQLITDN